MKKLILVLVCVLCFSFGCSAVKNVPVVVATGSMACTEYDSIVDIIRENKDSFSKKEWNKLSKENIVMRDAKDEIVRMYKQRDGDMETFGDLLDIFPLYEKVRVSYLSVHGIIKNRIDSGGVNEFSPEDRTMLENYSATCERLDAAIQEAMTSKDGVNYARVAKDILFFAKFLIPLILL